MCTGKDGEAVQLLAIKHTLVPAVEALVDGPAGLLAPNDEFVECDPIKIVELLGTPYALP